MSAAVQTAPMTLEIAEPEGHPTPTVRPASNVVHAPSAGPMGSAIAWLQAGGTMDQLRDMLALQREWDADQAKKAYVEAMAEFKKNPPTILKDKRVYYKAKDGGTAADYWHATLGNVTQAIVDGLAAVGISHSWKPERKGDRVHVTCTLTHKSGHSESVELDGPLDNSGQKNNIQQMSSTTTYLSRYTLLMITGLAVKDEILPDDDAGGAGNPRTERRELWAGKAAAAETAKDLQDVRRDGTKAFQAAKDREGYAEFAKAVKARAAQLEQAS